MVRLRSLAFGLAVIGCLLITQGISLAHGESLRLDKKWYQTGEEIRVHFTAPPHFPSDAWIGIVPSHIAHGSEAVNDQHDLSYEYIDKRTTGVIVLQTPTQPGSYDIRMHDTDSDGREVCSVTFKVGSGPAGHHHGGKPETGLPGVYVTQPSSKLDGQPAGIPQTPGQYIGGSYNPASHSLKLDKAVFRTGEQIVVRFTAPPLPNNAWIGIIPSRISHGSEQLNDQHDISYEYLEGRTVGTMTFAAPDQPGQYDFRLHDTDDDNGVELRAISFRVVL